MVAKMEVKEQKSVQNKQQVGAFQKCINRVNDIKLFIISAKSDRKEKQAAKKAEKVEKKSQKQQNKGKSQKQ